MMGKERSGFFVIATCIVGLSLAFLLFSATTTTAAAPPDKTKSENNNVVDKSSTTSSSPKSTSTSSATGEDSSSSLSSSEPTCETKVDSRNEGLLLYHFSSANSTQDEARKIIEDKENLIPEGISAIAVTATEQTKGRGTNGRVWMGAQGNTFVTICIRQSDWLSTKIPMTLLPLKIGSIIAHQLAQLFQSLNCNVSFGPNNHNAVAETTTTENTINVTVKWPNDVLVNKNKIAGVLIETAKTAVGYEYWFLIGIGVNVMYAPEVPTSGPNHGRTATCVQDQCPKIIESDGAAVAKDVGVDMAYNFTSWLREQHQTGDDSASATLDIVSEWKKWVDWKMPLILRDSADKDPVLPVDVEMDGQLRVQSQKAILDGNANKKERLVVADYFI